MYVCEDMLNHVLSHIVEQLITTLGATRGGIGLVYPSLVKTYHYHNGPLYVVDTLLSSIAGYTKPPAAWL